MIVDGVDFDDAALDYRKVARGALAGAVGGSRSTTLSPVEWLVHAYRRLLGEPEHARRLAEAVGECMSAIDLRIQSGALDFFAQIPAEGAARARLFALFHNRAAHQLPAPDSPSYTMDRLIAMAVSALVMSGDGEALAEAKLDLMAGGDPTPYLAALAQRDAEWVSARREEIEGAWGERAMRILRINLS